MFYKLNGSRVTLREFWWETKAFVWVGALVKLLKIRLRGSTDDLACDALSPFAVDAAKIPADVLDRFKPTLDQLTTLGFGSPIWHDQENIYQATHNTLATLRHEGGRAWVRVQCRTNFVRFPAKIKFFSTSISKTPGGYIATGNGKYDMAWPSTHNVQRNRFMPVAQVWSLHQQRMTAAVQRFTAEQLPSLAEEYHVSLAEFHLARGVFEPLGEEEYAMLPAAPVPLPVAPVSSQLEISDPLQTAPPALDPAPLDLLEIATLDELRRLQNKKANWRFTIALLAISGLFFIVKSKGSGREDGWEYVAILVGVLLFHELGHYVAMKVFGYRNLKMFFIPGFGAAVSGRHYNAPAWKKIVVSLMGPLPGIFAGAVLLILYGIFHNEVLYRISFFAIILNAFNLIPILPFDGGWAAHAALFSRHPKLDVSFRLIAALLLIGIGIKVPGATVLTYVAIASLIALPVANRLAVIVSELRKVPGLGVSTDNQTIPPETARIILAKIRQRFKRNLNARLAAQHVASVFESLNARPPSVGATIGLISLHAGGFALALIVGVAALATHGQDLFHRSRFKPKQYDVTLAQIQVSPQPAVRPRNIVIARFKSDSAARDFYQSLPPTRPGARFGQTLLIDFAPSEMTQQRDLFTRCQKLADDVFVQSSKMQANVSMSFALPDNPGAQQCFEDLQAYLSECNMRLIPPWAPTSDWPPAQRAEQSKLRQLVKELQSPDLKMFARTDLWKQVAAAQRSGDTTEVERLQAQAKQATEDAEQARQQKLQARYGHPELIQKWVEINTSKDYARREPRLKKEIAPQLGQWPAEKFDDLLASSGFSSNEKGSGPMLYCQFAEADTGLVAMTRWLFSVGVTDIHYNITGTPAVSEADVPDDRQ